MKTMPQWLKVIIIVVGVGFVLMIIAGVAGAMAIKRTIENLDRAAEQARADGEIAGINGTGETCVEAAVRRSADCDGFRFLCIPQVDAFLSGCLDEVPDDPAFCAGIPTSEDGEAMFDWSREICSRHGREDDIACTFGLTAANVHCYQQEEP